MNELFMLQIASLARTNAKQATKHPIGYALEFREHTNCCDISGPDSQITDLLGRAGLRDPAAVRFADGRGNLPPGHFPARARRQRLAHRLCAAIAPPNRWPLRREPEPPAALLPVPGSDEATPRQLPGALPRLT